MCCKAAFRRGWGVLLCVLLAPAPLCAGYAVSLGSYPQAEAEELHHRLAARGYPVFLQYGDSCEVRFGGFDTRARAEELVAKLRSEEKLVAHVEEEETLDQYELTLDDPGQEGRALDTGADSEYRDPRAKRIVALGLDLFGHPYKYGGTRVGKGIDCSYFVQIIFRELGVSLPRTSREQVRCGTPVERADLKVGDLLFFQKTYRYKSRKNKKRRAVTRINHVGIYIGNQEFIHATINVKRVTISNINEPYFVQRYAGARRVLPEAGEPQGGR